MKPLIVHCPCCGVEIDVDRESGRVVRHGPRPGDPADQDRFADAFETVKRRQAQTASAFDAARDAVRGREKQLDDVFQDAFRKVKERGDDGRPLNPLEMD